MAKGKNFTISITRMVYLIYVIRLISGRTPREIFELMISGDMKSSMITVGMDTLTRLETAGVEIAIEASVVLLAQQWFKRVVGSKQLVKLGPLRITP